MGDKKDVRTVRTVAALKNNLKELLMEKDFEKISVRKLCDKSDINRRTFYLHYDSIDDLLAEVLEEISLEFIEYTKGYDHFAEIDRIVADYFHFTNAHPLFEKLNVDAGLAYIREKITSNVTSKISLQFKKVAAAEYFAKKALAVYLNSNTVNMYRLWFMNKDTVPMDKAISLASALIQSGLRAV